MTRPLISVIIPTWNAAEYLGATLNSVLGQTHDAVEILVVDDGSTDHTTDLVSGLGDRVRYLAQDNWGGPSRPRNVALDAATGDLVAFFDADDLMDPEKLALAARAFSIRSDLDFLFTNFRVIDGDGSVIVPDFLAEYVEFRTELQATDEPDLYMLEGRRAYSQLLRSNFIGTSSVVCRREGFERIGRFDEAMLNADDVDMWRRWAYAGARFGYLDRVLHSYRKLAGGVTGRSAARRLPAVLHGFRKQLDNALTAEERALVMRRIETTELQLAYGLCEDGRFGESMRAYGQAMMARPSSAALRGLLRTAIRRCLGQAR